jgi:hypothetical protein
MNNDGKEEQTKVKGHQDQQEVMEGQREQSDENYLIEVCLMV